MVNSNDIPPTSLSSNDKPALALDMDGTLIKNDLTHELFFLCARKLPLLLIPALVMVAINKSRAKRYLCLRLHQYFDPKTLPYHQEILDLAETYRANGGSEPNKNLTSHDKAAFLTKRHGKNFIYAGNSTADYAVWKAAAKGYGVNAPSKSYTLKREDGSPVVVEQILP